MPFRAYTAPYPVLYEPNIYSHYHLPPLTGRGVRVALQLRYRTRGGMRYALQWLLVRALSTPEARASEHKQLLRLVLQWH